MENFEPFAVEYGYDVALNLHTFETFALWQMGLADQAEALRHEILSIAEASRNPYSICFALAFGMALGCDRGDTDLVLEQSERLIPLAKENHLYFWLAPAACGRGGALLQKGQTVEALESIQQGLSLYHNFGVLVSYAFYLSYLAAAHLKAGRASDGLAVTDEALSLCQKLTARFHEPDLLRLKGELLLLQGDRRAAEDHLRQALRLAQDRHALSYELRAATSLSRMIAGMGRREEAVDLLGTVYKRFNEGFDTADLRQAASLLRDLGAPSDGHLTFAREPNGPSPR
jgi:tetratricopeptide (TPR) repeat protein